jgi:glycosyltransferase involved in cell wall biosynthesis
MPTEKPRVLHVIARFNIGGTARYLDNLLPGLAEHFETLLVVGHVQGFEIEDSRLEKFNFVRIENLGRKISPVRDFQAYLQLRKTVKRFKPQIIHSHTFKAGVLARLMFFRIPKVHTFHGHLILDPEFSKGKLRLIINIERLLTKVTEKIITVGAQVSQDLLQVGVGKPAQYTSIASEGETLNFLSRQEARTNLGVQAGTPVVLWMARMSPVKNPFLALDVARLLPDVRFLMAGGGELFERIKDAAPPNVTLLSWVNPAHVISAADVFLSTSLNEGVPYSLLEVFSAGLPVVAVESGAIAEILQNGINGLLTSQDSAEIANHISALFSSPMRRSTLAQSAKDLSIQNSKLNKMLPAHLFIYRGILNTDLFGSQLRKL